MHRSIGGVVGNDMLPGDDEMQALLRRTGQLSRRKNLKRGKPGFVTSHHRNSCVFYNKYNHKAALF